MDASIITTANPAFFPAMAGARNSVASSSSSQVPMSSRQTEALLPAELFPLGQGSTQQDVAQTTAESSSQANQIRQMANQANAYLQQADTQLDFQVDSGAGKVVVYVVNTDTNSVIRRIPPESFLQLSDQIAQMKGLLFDANG